MSVKEGSEDEFNLVPKAELCKRLRALNRLRVKSSKKHEKELKELSENDERAGELRVKLDELEHFDNLDDYNHYLWKCQLEADDQLSDILASDAYLSKYFSSLDLASVIVTAAEEAGNVYKKDFISAFENKIRKLMK